MLIKQAFNERNDSVYIIFFSLESIELYVKLPNDPVSPSVGLSVGRLVGLSVGRSVIIS